MAVELYIVNHIEGAVNDMRGRVDNPGGDTGYFSALSIGN